jgi:hypothetical protein
MLVTFCHPYSMNCRKDFWEIGIFRLLEDIHFRLIIVLLLVAIATGRFSPNVSILIVIGSSLVSQQRNQNEHFHFSQSRDVFAVLVFALGLVAIAGPSIVNI